MITTAFKSEYTGELFEDEHEEYYNFAMGIEEDDEE
jgi:hypothetical protein